MKLNYKIYKITNKKTNEIYFGSTTLSIKTRFKQHSLLTNTCRSKLLFEEFPDENIVEVLHEIETDDKILVLQLERFYIEKTPHCINKNIPNRSLAEYKNTFNKELKIKARQYSKEYYQLNKQHHNYVCSLWKEKNKALVDKYQKEYQANLRNTDSYKLYQKNYQYNYNQKNKLKKTDDTCL